MCQFFIFEKGLYYCKTINCMGKGDKKSKRGKIALGTYGNSRKKKTIKARLKRSASKKKVEVGSKEKTKRASKKA